MLLALVIRLHGERRGGVGGPCETRVVRVA